jgi:hypothetical protein
MFSKSDTLKLLFILSVVVRLYNKLCYTYGITVYHISVERSKSDLCGIYF